MVRGCTVTCCPDPREIDRLPARGAADLVLRRAADLGEAEGRARGDARAALPDEQRERARAGRSRPRSQKVRLEQARRGGARGAGRRAWHAGRRGGVLQAARRSSGSTSSIAVNVGAAPTPLEVLEFFHAIGIPVGGALGHVGDLRRGDRQPARARSSSARSGPPAPGIEIKLADDGEVLIRGRRRS